MENEAPGTTEGADGHHDIFCYFFWGGGFGFFFLGGKGRWGTVKIVFRYPDPLIEFI